MLEILQYLSLISAFLLPWLVGSIIKFAKSKDEKDKKKLKICSVICVLCVAVIGISVFIAFSIQ